MKEASYNDKVFINCPFDSEYLPLFRAAIFAVYRCGFLPISSKTEDNGADIRIEKIQRLIEDCRYGIHDISRTELNVENLPRFNRPFELGIFLGARRYGDDIQKRKIALVLDTEPYRYLKFISDLSGIDLSTHNNNVESLIRIIRDWLATSSRRVTIVGDVLLVKEYNEFVDTFPGIVEQAGLSLNNLSMMSYYQIIEASVNCVFTAFTKE